MDRQGRGDRICRRGVRLALSGMDGRAQGPYRCAGLRIKLPSAESVATRQNRWTAFAPLTIQGVTFLYSSSCARFPAARCASPATRAWMSCSPSIDPIKWRAKARCAAQIGPFPRWYPGPEHCDCNHSTVLHADDSLAMAFPPVLSGVTFSGTVRVSDQ